MKLRHIWLISVLFLAGSLAVAGSSQANTYDWQTAGGGNWQLRQTGILTEFRA